MTLDKGFKRLVRTRQRTGESYAAARRRLLAKRKGEKDMTVVELLPVDVDEWGFRLSLPPGWSRVAPDTSRWEVLRVIAPPPGRPFVTVNKWGLTPGTEDLDEYERSSLNSLGPDATAVRSSRTTLGGMPAIQADYRGRHPMGADRIVSLRVYGLVQPPIGWVFAFGTDDFARDVDVFDAIAATIALD